MAITTFRFCILVLCLACIRILTGRSGACPRANDEHTASPQNTGDPSIITELGLLLDKTSSDYPSQRTPLERTGGRGEFSSINGLLSYSIFDYYRFLLRNIGNPFTRHQASDRTPSKAELDHNVLFVFGDSLFDAGNNKYINESSDLAGSYPYGYTYFRNATGRVCDGRVVPDFIAEYAKLPLIPPSLQPGADFSYGANFASAGSAVLDSDGESSYVINLKEQVQQFKEMVRKYNETLGPRRAGELLRKAVYLFSTGGNDYLALYVEFMEEDRVLTQAEQRQFVEEIVGNITNAIMEIYQQGGRKIAFQNVGPLGCLPIVDIEFPELNGSCATELLSMPTLHNQKLYAALTDLAERLEGFKFSVMDYFSSLYDRMMNPSKYGFKAGRMPCYRSTSAAYWSEAKGCAVGNRTLCDYPSAYVLFNEAHTTQSANSQLAKLIWSGDPSVTRPYNVKQLFEEEE